MQIQVNVNNLKLLKKDALNESEYKIHDVEFEFKEEYTQDLVKVALFTQNEKTYKMAIENNKCSIPAEILAQKGTFVLGVYAYEVENEELKLRYSPSPIELFIDTGSYIPDEEVENSEPLTPTDKEQFEARLSKVELDAEQIETNRQNILDLQENKADKSEIPTKISDLTNDSDFVEDANYVHTDNNFTNEYKQEIEQNTSDIASLDDTKADKTEIPDVSVYSLITETGSQIALNINSSNFQMTAILKDKNGNTIYTSNVIDLPLETMVVNASYDSTTKEIILTLQNGTTVRFSVADLVSGLQTEITSENKLASDLVDDTNQTNKFVTTSEKTGWNGKYTKPNGGIPKTDLAEGVQTSLGKADSAIQEHQDISGKEDKSNKVTELTEESTDEEYPSAKAVYESDQENYKEINKLKEKIERYKKQLPKVEGQGTDITLNNTIEDDFIEFNIEGRSVQESTTGKQLFDKTGEMVTKNGLTSWTYNDGVWTLIPSGITNPNFTISVSIPAGTYILTSEKYLSAASALTNEAGTVTKNFGSNYNNVTFTTAEESTKFSFNWQNPGNTDPITLDLNSLMIRPSTISDDTYEKYTGGNPAPNPNYPQEIKSCGDNVNVFDVETSTASQLCTKSDNVFTTSAMSSYAVPKIKLGVPLSIANGTDYYISYDVKINSGDIKNLNYYGRLASDENLSTTTNFGELVGTFSMSNSYQRVVWKTTATSDFTANYLFLQATSGITNAQTISIKNIKIEKDKATSYSPYGMGSITEKIVNKNWLKKPDFTTKTINGVTWTINEDGSVTANGTANGASMFTVYDNIDFKTARAVYYKAYSGNDVQTQFNFIDENGNNLVRYNTNIYESSDLLVKGLTSHSIYVSNGKTVNNITIYPILALTKDLTYVAHEEQNISIPTQQPMRSIGDVRDDFVKVDGNWFERHKIGEYVANNDLRANGISETRVDLVTPTVDIEPGLNGNSDAFKNIVMCNMLQNELTNNSGLSGTTNASNIRVNLSTEFASTYAEATTFLTNGGLKINYVKLTPTLLPCTEEQTAMLNKIEELYTYYGQTNINSPDEVAPYIKASGLKDLNTLDSDINNIKQAIVALGGVVQ